MMRVEWFDREWICMPERALWWPAQRALICADLHIGKDEAFRRSGVPLPQGALADDLARLDAALTRVPAQRLIILGDFFHARDGCGPRVMKTLTTWRERHRKLEVLLVRGNHDRDTRDHSVALQILSDRELELDGVCLRHQPPRTKRPEAPYISGHIHPTARLQSAGERLQAPCFWFRTKGIVLPAFGSLTGGCLVAPSRGERAILVGPDGCLVEWRRSLRAA